MTASRQQFGRYRILAPLGAGGMGEVYRAHDPQLRRDVAVKILTPHRSVDRDAVARMLREARAAAAVEHSSIVTVHDVGEEDGQCYLVTELLEGKTLRARLKRGPLSIGEALEYSVSIASALAAAHAAGVVHRDLKPENIMVTDSGTLKVLDFGVAKFMASPASGTTVGLTEDGAVVGTPAYMAPEQLEARDVDYRADQFALGVVMFEMLTGRRPFTGASMAESAASILRDEPPPVMTVRQEVPPTLSRLVARCLAKRPDGRFESSTDLARALADVRTDLTVLSTPPPAAAAAVPGSRWLWPSVLAVIAVIAAVAIAFPRLRPGAAPAQPLGTAQAIAVLPFSVIGDGNSYLSDGLTEAVTRELGHVKGARVIAANSTLAYRGKPGTPAAIGRELGVDVVVQGSVQRDGERLSVSASLTNVADGSAIWTNRYHRAASDLLSVQDDIAWQVAAKLAAALQVEAPPRPPDTPKTTPEAYDAYLRGLTLLRGPATGFPAAITEFERAVASDPTFALAHARLASAYTQEFFYNKTDPDLEQKAFVEIEKALAANPDLAEGYLARAQLTWNLRNGFPHERAISDLKRAIANNPNLSEAFVELGKLYFHIGLVDKSIAANSQAINLDPRSASASRRLVEAMADGGRRDEVAEALVRNPQWTLRSRAGALAFLRRTDEAIAAIAPDGINPEHLKKIEMNDIALLARLLARAGRTDDARRALAVAIPLAANPSGLSDTHHAQFSIGCAYALLGDLDRATEWVTKASNEGYPSYPHFSHEADLASLKEHAGFRALLARMEADHERWLKTL